jgi:hypothetical protein
LARGQVTQARRQLQQFERGVDRVGIDGLRERQHEAAALA